MADVVNGSTVLAKWNAERAQAKTTQLVTVDSSRLQKQILKRAYKAAAASRLVSSWTTSNASADQNIVRALDILRARSRDLADNNDYFKKFLQMVGNNVVGPKGFTLLSQPRDPGKDLDRIDADIIEAGLAEWSERGNCDVTGQYSFTDACRMFITTVARDGEVLFRKIRGRKVNKYGYALQLLDIDRLDVNYNMLLPNGNLIRMSVEIDTFGRPVAYHLRTMHPAESLTASDGGRMRIERVPAEDIIHRFIPLRPEQRRGIPWAHASMLRMNMLSGYEEAAIVAARTGAAKMGFFTSPDGDAKPLADDEDDDGEFFTEAEAGTFGVLPKGYEFTPWTPDYPHQNYEAFIKSTLRGISSGLGISYNSLANDLEGVNFSSIRSGVLEERDNWMVLQNWMIEGFLTEVYRDWLQMALLNGALAMGSGSPLPASKYAKFVKHTWQGRRWAWVDPVKDVEANLLAIDGKLKSRTSVIAETGRDRDDVWDELEQEEKDAKARGLQLQKPTTAPPKAPPASDSPPDNDAQK